MRWLVLLISAKLTALCPFTVLLGAALLGGGTASTVWDGSFDFGAEALYWSPLDKRDFGWGARIRSSYVTPEGSCFMTVSGLVYRDAYTALDSRVGHWFGEHWALYVGGRYGSLRGLRGMGPLIGTAWTYSMGMLQLQAELGLSTLIGRRMAPGTDGRLFLSADGCWRWLRVGGELGLAMEHYWQQGGFAGPFASLVVGF